MNDEFRSRELYRLALHCEGLKHRGCAGYCANTRRDNMGLERTGITRKIGSVFFVFEIAQLNGQILTEEQELRYYEALARKVRKAVNYRQFSDEEVTRIGVELFIIRQQ